MDDLWSEMVAYAQGKSLKGGDYKKLNLPFEPKLLAQPREVRERMEAAVEDFVYGLLTDCFNAADTAPLAIDAILQAGSCDLGAKASRIEDPLEWSEDKIKFKAQPLAKEDSASQGNYDD